MDKDAAYHELLRRVLLGEKTLVVKKLIESGGCLAKDLLWQTVHRSQEVAWGDDNAHSRSNFNRWVGELERFRVIEKRWHEICLTNIGRWVALGNIEQRTEFARQVICENCAKQGPLTVVSPIEGTVRIRGSELYWRQLSVDTSCPKCENKSQLCIPIEKSELELWELHESLTTALGSTP